MLRYVIILLILGSTSYASTITASDFDTDHGSLFFHFDLVNWTAGATCRPEMRLPPILPKLQDPLVYFDLNQSPLACRHNASGRTMCHCTLNVAICFGKVRDIEECEKAGTYFRRPLKPDSPRTLMQTIQIVYELLDSELDITIMLYNENWPRRLHASQYLHVNSTRELLNLTTISLKGNGLEMRGDVQLVLNSQLSDRKDYMDMIHLIRYRDQLMEIANYTTVGPCTPGWTGERCQTAECKKNACVHGKCCGPELCCCDIGYGGDACAEQLSSCTNATCMEAYVNVADKLDAKLDRSYYRCEDEGLCGSHDCERGDEFADFYCKCPWDREQKCDIVELRGSSVGGLSVVLILAAAILSALAVVFIASLNCRWRHYRHHQLMPKAYDKPLVLRLPTESKYGEAFHTSA